MGLLAELWKQPRGALTESWIIPVLASLRTRLMHRQGPASAVIVLYNAPHRSKEQQKRPA